MDDFGVENANNMFLDLNSSTVSAAGGAMAPPDALAGAVRRLAEELTAEKEKVYYYDK